MEIIILCNFFFLQNKTFWIGKNIFKAIFKKVKKIKGLVHGFGWEIENFRWCKFGQSKPENIVSW